MATQKNFVVKNGIEITESIKLGNKTITNLLDSAAVATIARTAAFDSAGEINQIIRNVAFDSAGDLTGVADPAGTAVALAIALG
tara:strand:- start:27 stop:278 length:252 start_codon:yes stop_codon:yes gene_type:complete